ncbi:MAG: helix-turn-helix transcriptional regulator [Planctomycetota bacterium]|jgi:AraC-like DNA-binding protein|nr:helix-turn-helix transcriptional regulator [Planctomycetota bacterium]
MAERRGAAEDPAHAFLQYFMSPSRFRRLRKDYEGKWMARLALIDGEGVVLAGKPLPGGDAAENRARFKTLVEESLRWGEAPADMFRDGTMAWAVPLMLNTRLVGGVAAVIRRRDLFPGDDGRPRFDIRDAAVELRRLLEAENLTNAPLLEMRRGQYLSERRRAEAIHAFKAYSPDFRSIYLREEPALMSAIRKGDREEAREILNRILVVLHYQAGENFALIKSFFLEMMTLMYRAAVEAGCESRELLGANYERFSELSSFASEEELGPWVHEVLDGLIDAIHRHRNISPLALLQGALAFMHENLDQDISRDDAARAAHLSPAHFSRLFKKEMKESFTDMLNRMRIDQAAELLARSDQSLCMIALDCGFKDQSYFTKVFRKYVKETPREYRLRLRAARRVRV